MALAQSLADTATVQLADTLETGPEEIKPDNGKGTNKPDSHLQHHTAALRAWEARSNTDKDGKTAKEQAGQQPLLVLSAPAGLAAVTSTRPAAGTGWIIMETGKQKNRHERKYGHHHEIQRPLIGLPNNILRK